MRCSSFFALATLKLLEVSAPPRKIGISPFGGGAKPFAFAICSVSVSARACSMNWWIDASRSCSSPVKSSPER